MGVWYESESCKSRTGRSLRDTVGGYIKEQTVNFVNLTDHVIRLNDGTEFAPSGMVARITTEYTPFVDGVAGVTFGSPEGLPDPKPDTLYIVSGILAGALKGIRSDLVSPATGHPKCIRDKGQVVSVPGFVRG